MAERGNNMDCCCKHKQRDEQQVKKLINRLNRIEGQVKGIKKMLENDAYCPDIMIQVSSINAALNSFNKELLSAHIHSCVVDDIKNGDYGTVDELVDLLNKISK